MTELWIGVDPDKHGSCAFLTDSEVTILLTPTLSITSGRAKIDEVALASLFRDLLAGRAKNAFAVLEQQQAQIWVPTNKLNPKTGKPILRAVSTGDAMLGYGAWGMLLACCDVAREDVRATVWKKLMMGGLPKAATAAARKQQSVLIAKRLFPTVSLCRGGRCQIDDPAMAEALLLAEYGRRLRGA